MDITSAATAATNASAAASTSGKASSALASNFDSFIKLLTTQLKNQDPTAPEDASEFTKQLVQFSSVEQQVATNTNLEKLISLYQSGQQSNAVSYIGKGVEAVGNATQLEGGVANMIYTLDKQAANASVTIKNAQGDVVFRGQGLTAAGRNQVSWDGMDISTGQKAPNGNYTYEVSATEGNGKVINATTYTTGRVNAVEMAGGSIALNVAGVTVPFDQVLRFTDNA